MTARSQGHPMYQSQTSSTQHLRERQRFFEDVLEHDVDLFYPQLHLLRECWRPPLDSVSSMEVNFDNLETSDSLDISELDPNDAFQQSEDPSTVDISDTSDFRLHFPVSFTAVEQDDDTTDRKVEMPQSIEIEAPDTLNSDAAPCDNNDAPSPKLNP